MKIRVPFRCGFRDVSSTGEKLARKQRSVKEREHEDEIGEKKRKRKHNCSKWEKRKRKKEAEAMPL